MKSTQELISQQLQQFPTKSQHTKLFIFLGALSTLYIGVLITQKYLAQASLTDNQPTPQAPETPEPTLVRPEETSSAHSTPKSRSTDPSTELPKKTPTPESKSPPAPEASAAQDKSPDVRSPVFPSYLTSIRPNELNPATETCRDFVNVQPAAPQTDLGNGITTEETPEGEVRVSSDHLLQERKTLPAQSFWTLVNAISAPFTSQPARAPK